MAQLSTWASFPRFDVFSWPRLSKVALSMTDQALSVGGMFIVNVALARTQTKEEYGTFVLSYSVFTFLAALHNSAILDPYTVFGSGRYHARCAEYFRLMARSNALVALLLSLCLLCCCALLHWLSPRLVSGALVGLGLTIGFLLTGLFVRRSFYVQRKPWLAAGTSLTFFGVVGGGLWLANGARVLNGFSAFLIVAAAWMVAGGCFLRKLPFGRAQEKFLDVEPLYWKDHWKYSRWVLITAFVFQLTSQGYYWLVAAFLSVKDVAELRALYLIVGSADQIFIALSYLVLPLLAAHFAAKRMDLLLSLWRRYAAAILGIMILFALFLDIFGKALVHLLYRGKFDDVASLLLIFSFLPLLMGIGNTISDAIRAAEKPRYVFFAYLASGATTFLAGIPLVIHFGLRGAVYGLLLSGTAYTSALSLAFALHVRGQTGAEVDPSLG